MSTILDYPKFTDFENSTSFLPKSQNKFPIPLFEDEISTLSLKRPRFMFQVMGTSAIFLQKLVQTWYTSSLENLNFEEYELELDPMKNLTGESAQNMLELLTKHGEKNEIELIKDAQYEADTMKFKLEINFNEE